MGARVTNDLRSAQTSSADREGGRRRWGRVAVGVAAMVVGAWLFAALYVSARDRVSVVAVTRPVARLETITRADLRVVQVGVDPNVVTVPASELASLVGRTARTDLVAGALLAPGSVGRGAGLVGGDDAVVGLTVGQGDAPSSQLRAGVSVSLVVRPVSGSSDPPDEVGGRVLDTSPVTLSDGQRPVEVVVAKEDAAAVSAAAADKRVSVVTLGG
jgi:hypothetical protein